MDGAWHEFQVPEGGAALAIIIVPGGWMPMLRRTFWSLALTLYPT